MCVCVCVCLYGQFSFYFIQQITSIYEHTQSFKDIQIHTLMLYS